MNPPNPAAMQQMMQQQQQKKRSFLSGVANVMLQRNVPLPPSLTGTPYPANYDPNTSPWKSLDVAEIGVVRLAGKEVDLFRLWSYVLQAGGSTKVCYFPLRLIPYIQLSPGHTTRFMAPDGTFARFTRTFPGSTSQWSNFHCSRSRAVLYISDRSLRGSVSTECATTARVTCEPTTWSATTRRQSAEPTRRTWWCTKRSIRARWRFARFCY